GRPQRDAPRHDPPRLAKVDQAAQVPGGGETPRGDHHRRRQADPPEIDGERRSHPGHRPPVPMGTPSGAVAPWTPSADGSVSPGRPAYRSHRTLLALKTGPSTHARRGRYPLLWGKATGTTQVKHNPRPHPMSSSRTTWAGMR